VQLCKDEQQLIGTFNENTRRQIRKSEKLNLNAVAINSDNEIFDLHKIYDEMASTRGADKLSLDYFNRFNKFVKKYPDRGLILALKEDNKIIAGVMILNNHKMAWYIHGTSDSRYRDRPLTFVCHWEAMRIFSKRGLESYNFGGLGAPESVEKAKQGINRFKFGFSKEVVYSTPEYYLSFSPFSQLIYKYTEVLHSMRKNFS
jgi:lipid II:glycine glycyltransferase (peptidoglycan interpeptide bridge formation enzyme)